MTDMPAKKSDLGVRTLSAIVMVAVAGTALWLGGWWWTVFVTVVALGVLWEWRGLVRAFTRTAVQRYAWLVGGIVYIGVASAMLIAARDPYDEGMKLLLLTMLGVVGTDVGAYFAGRTIGGPRIAPSISPSKTWAGLGGGIIGAAAAYLILAWAWASGLCETLTLPPPLPSNVAMFDGPCSFAGLPPPAYLAREVVAVGAIIAVLAQAGDFFESWMKRRAGVKDSSNLIPGHGGLFDRVDGLLAVSFAIGLLSLGQIIAFFTLPYPQ